MNCEETKRRLSAYLDGELPPEEAQRVRRHLAECASCPAELEALRRLEAALDALPGALAPPGFARQVREAAQAEGARTAPFGGVLARVAAALLAVAGLLCGVQTGRAVRPVRSARTQVTEADAIDLQADALSAIPTGSLADIYLALGQTADDGEAQP